MTTTTPPPLVDESTTPSSSELRADIEATLLHLLIQFRDSPPAIQQDLTRFVQSGTEALMVQLHSPAWLDSQQSATLLGVPEAVVIAQADHHTLPAIRDDRGQPRVHRRDVTLYRMSQQLGASEGQWTRVTASIGWSADLVEAGFNPWDEITPG